MTQNNEEEQKLKLELLETLEAKEHHLLYNKIDTIFPDEGMFCRALYPKHIAYMTAGKKHNQRAIIAGNRTGKTLMGGCEMTYHLTGIYPHWWQGRVFANPIEAWAASVSNEATKNVMQKVLLGDSMSPGTGLIPGHLIGKEVKKPGVAEAVETVYVKHTSGRYSRIDFKSYEQGRAAFQGTKKQFIWLDEEPSDYSIYSECLARTMDKFEPGMISCTFTPLSGLSDVVLSFLVGGRFPEGGVNPDTPYKYVGSVTWDDIPHLSEEQKAEQLATYPKHEQAARTQGIPSLGSGAIFPFLERDIVVRPFKLEPWWPRVYGLDVGWNRTAAVWVAQDPDTKIYYIYSEHYLGEVSPAIHASGIKNRGDWIEGVIDPASRTASQSDGKCLLDLYEREGLMLQLANNAVEAGIYKMYQMFESGTLKVFSNLNNWLAEFRTYQRDLKGKIIKKNDHLMDATRYTILSGLDYMTTEPDPDKEQNDSSRLGSGDPFTGY